MLHELDRLPLLVIGLIVWLVVESTGGRDDRPASRHQLPPQALGTPIVGLPAPQGSSSARTVLDERYARGEIERDEYLSRRGGLG